MALREIKVGAWRRLSAAFQDFAHLEVSAPGAPLHTAARDTVLRVVNSPMLPVMRRATRSTLKPE